MHKEGDFKMRKGKINKAKICLYVGVTLLYMLTGCNTNEQDEKTASVQKKKKEEIITQDEKFAEIEKEFNARLGVYAIDTGTNQRLQYNPDDRFAYASTFKVLASAILLKQNSIEDLERVVTFSKDDLVTYSPVTEKHVDTGMTLGEISEAAIRYSDNTAANLLLEELGGPEQFKQALRDLGDDVTQPERFETELNDFAPGKKRDTSTPKAMANTLKKVALDDFLPDDKRELLHNWMKGNATGDKLIRAGAPAEWVVGDKSGAGSYGTRNDIAIVWPPDREPIVIAVMSRHEEADAEYDDALIAKAAEIALNALK